MATEAARVFARIGADTREYEQKMAGASRKMRETVTDMRQEADRAALMISQGFGGIAGGVGVAGFVALGSKIIGAANELDKLNESAVRAERSYRRLADVPVQAGLAQLRQATQGGLDNLALMENSTRLIAMHLADSNTEAANLIRIATQLGTARGIANPQEALNNLMPMLANQSYLRLDEMLVSGERVKALTEKFKAAGMDSGQAFKLAFLQEAEATLARLGEQTVSASAQMAAANQNLKTSFAQAAGSGLFGQAIQAFKRDWAEDAQAVSEYFGRIAQGRQELGAFNQQLQEMRRQGALTDEQYKAMQKGVGALATQVAWGTLTHEELAAQMAALRANTPGVAAAWSAWEGQIHEVDSAVDAAQARLEQMDGRRYIAQLHVQITTDAVALEQRMSALANFRPGPEGLAGFAAQRGVTYTGAEDTAEYIENKTEAQRRYNYAVADEAGKLAILHGRLEGVVEGSAEWYEIQTDIAQLQDSIARSGERSGATAAREAEAAAREAAQQLRAQVEGILSPTQVTGEDYLATKFGLYENKWDEYVRRLRSAATDAKSAWRDMIPADILAQGQERVNLWVAQQERAFYAGQLPDQIDWAAFERQYREQQAMARAKEALVQEAMRRVVGMGLQVDTQQVSRALGLELPPQDGAQFAQGFGEGARAVNVAAQVTASFSEQFQQERGTWMAQGQLAMGWLVEGMKTGLTPTQGRAWAAALLPYLVTALAQNGARP